MSISHFELYIYMTLIINLKPFMLFLSYQLSVYVGQSMGV